MWDRSASSRSSPPAPTTTQNPLPNLGLYLLYVFSAAITPWNCSQHAGRSLKPHHPSRSDVQSNLSAQRLLDGSLHLTAEQHAQEVLLQKPGSCSSWLLSGMTLKEETALWRAPKHSMRAKEADSPGAIFAGTKLRLPLPLQWDALLWHCQEENL